MLSIHSARGTRDCDQVDRRDFLRIGALGLGGLTLPCLLQQQARASTTDAVRDRAVVLLFLAGGPSHIETFAPNMDAPAPRRSVIGEVPTRLPGVTFGSAFPKLAALADQLAVVRSFSPHNIGDHEKAIHHVLRGGTGSRSLGAMHTRLRRERITPQGVPSFAELIENEQEAEYRQDMDRMRVGNAAGDLGAACAPFTVNGQGTLQQDMQLALPLERFEARRSLFRDLDRLQARNEQMAATDEFHRLAVDVLLGGAVRKALDLSREDRRLVDRYDTSRMTTGWLQRRPSTLGQRMLLARRLVEAGCRFVTVGMAGWDNHGNNNHPGVGDGTRMLGAQVDHAVSVFLEDVRQRGLSDKILLVMTGEFGRTPTMQGNGGRDHWPSLGSLVLAGGGLPMGQVIGRMSRQADVPASDPIRLENLVATLFHAMFDVGRLRLDSTLPTALVRLVESGRPIRELIGY